MTALADHAMEWMKSMQAGSREERVDLLCCYIGQEILTRMKSRGKMGKQLIKVPINAEDATSVGYEFSLAIRRLPP